MSSTPTAFNVSHLDILVNNAGLGPAGTRIEEITSDEFDKIMAVNVRAVIFMTQAFILYTRRGGRILNLSSISARCGYVTQSVYSASKAPVEALTRAWATELSQKYNMTAHAANPGQCTQTGSEQLGKFTYASILCDNANSDFLAPSLWPGDCRLGDCKPVQAEWISGTTAVSSTIESTTTEPTTIEPTTTAAASTAETIPQPTFNLFATGQGPVEEDGLHT
ncbi:short chain oxidoreductase [Fusarium denticulatum]|uniref:Short chain oxidoreductase n=1 Tax=Fusarium denticulatum TaxID=48507 RepID=A0A8H5TZM4_9HYPO|nr:short chain oxidoreductase [Fusarium denticulatum]